MGMTVHWEICRKKGFNLPDKWYEHKPLPCTENESFITFLDFNIQTDNIIEHRRPDTIIIDKTNRKTQIVDFAVSADHRLEISQQSKIENYQDLKCELQKLWNLNTYIVPIVNGALGAIPKFLEKHLNVEVNISQMQTTVLLNSAKIIRKVLEF